MEQAHLVLHSSHSVRYGGGITKQVTQGCFLEHFQTFRGFLFLSLSNLMQRQWHCESPSVPRTQFSLSQELFLWVDTNFLWDFSDTFQTEVFLAWMRAKLDYILSVESLPWLRVRVCVCVCVCVCVAVSVFNSCVWLLTSSKFDEANISLNIVFVGVWKSGHYISYFIQGLKLLSTYMWISPSLSYVSLCVCVCKA